MSGQRGKRIVIVGVLLGFFSMGAGVKSLTWQKNVLGISETDIRTLTTDPHNNRIIYVGTSKSLYQSKDKGKHYKRILEVQGNEKAINSIYVTDVQPSLIYAATDQGLYESQSNDGRWQRTYFDSDLESRRCFSVLRDDNQIYLGTAKGLFKKSINEQTWQRIQSLPNDKPIYHIASNKGVIYVSTDQELFKSDKDKENWQRIFSLGINVREEINSIDEEDTLPNQISFIKSLQILNVPADYVFFATTRGIYSSQDQGATWDPLPTDTFSVDQLTSLIILPYDSNSHGEASENPLDHLVFLAGTKRGVFLKMDGTWVPIYQGIETNEIRDVVYDAQNTVYAATNRGVFYLTIEKTLPSFLKSRGQKVTKSQNSEKNYEKFDQEPTIQQVHQWAIDYAEVNPKKIEQWRNAAKHKAILPSLSVGLDRDATENFHWDTGPSPDVLQKGRDLLDWDVSLTWNLGELIWNNDQTSIDSRSKLMVELRENIVDQVTRLYFERKRLEIEARSNTSTNSRAKLDTQMRIEELTALIDGFTGGKFSENMKGSQPSAFSYQ